jgi:adenylate cyclase
VTVRGVLLLQLAANGAGALLVLAYLAIVFPDSSPADGKAADINTLVFGLYLLVAVVIALPVNKKFLDTAMGWVRDGRPPTPIERWATLAQPLQQTVSAFLVWVGAAVIFGVLNQTVANSLRVAAGITVAGLITCCLLYLLLERHFRPVFALALEDADLPRWRREIQARLMLAWLLGSAVPLIAVGLAPVGVPAAELAQSGTRLTILVITGVVAGGLVMRAAATAVSLPIEEVSDALARVEEGDLEVEVPVTHIGEIGRLQHGFNAMVGGLRERRRLQDLFGRQVGTDVARRAVERDPQLGGEAREITALFVDLENFTSFTESHTPEEVVAELNTFFEIVIRVVMDEGGWVNKFEGDAALCIFGAPAHQPDHAARALRAAARLPAEVAKLPDAPGVGIGVATGPVVAGNIGPPDLARQARAPSRARQPGHDHRRGRITRRRRHRRGDPGRRHTAHRVARGRHGGGARPHPAHPPVPTPALTRSSVLGLVLVVVLEHGRAVGAPVVAQLGEPRNRLLQTEAGQHIAVG